MERVHHGDCGKEPIAVPWEMHALCGARLGVILVTCGGCGCREVADIWGDADYECLSVEL